MEILDWLDAHGTAEAHIARDEIIALRSALKEANALAERRALVGKTGCDDLSAGGRAMSMQWSSECPC